MVLAAVERSMAAPLWHKAGQLAAQKLNQRRDTGNPSRLPPPAAAAALPECAPRSLRPPEAQARVPNPWFRLVNRLLKGAVLER